jgi:hypothetical protein
MAYEFPNDTIKDIVWKRTFDRGKKEADCLLWTGPFNNKEKSAYWEYIPITDEEKEVVKKRNVYQVQKLAYQIYHPDTIFTNTDMMVSTCGKKECFSEEHLELKSKKSEWNPEQAWEKIQKMSIRKDAIENQNIGCLIWQGQKDKKEYGIISIFGKKYPSHLLSVMVKDQITEVPKDDLGRRLVTRHLCKEKLCCEPSHLLLGDFDQNNYDDKIRDGILLRGEEVKNSKLTIEQVIAIKLSWKPLNDPEYLSMSKRVELFGVPRYIILSIDYGKSWTHVPGNNDEVVQEKIKERKKMEQKTRTEVRKNGIPEKDYKMLKDKIYAKSKIQEPTENDINNTPCRIWQGSVHENYGRIQYNYILFFVHVIICEWKNKIKKPEGMITRHLCNNKLCVEAEHLEFNTSRQNMIDALENNDLKTKLNYKKAEDIRNELALDFSKLKIDELATKYEVAPKTIRALKYNKQWKKD